MKIIETKQAETSQTPHNVEVKKLYDTDNAIVVHIALKPGESLKKHITPVDVCFYILEGNGIVEIGDERSEVSSDMLIESPMNIPHRLLNNGDELFRFLVIKVPKPTKATKLL